MPSGIVYNIYYYEVLQVHLPNAFIAHIADDGSLGKMEKKVSPEVLKSYGFYNPDDIHRPALDICDELSPASLEKKFVKPSRLNLAKAVEEKSVKKAVLNIISRKMDRFISHLVENELPICLNIQRDRSLENLRINYVNQWAEPELFFKKTTEGIDYTLTIRTQKSQYHPSDRDINILCDQPGWVVEGSQFYKLRHINGNKLKPFLNKKTIHIPSRLTHEYLDKFVKDIITKASVISEGFEIKR